MALKCQVGKLSELMAQQENFSDENRINDEARKNNVRLVGDLQAAHKKVLLISMFHKCYYWRFRLLAIFFFV